jgi:hypothetical protein
MMEREKIVGYLLNPAHLDNVIKGHERVVLIGPAPAEGLSLY